MRVEVASVEPQSLGTLVEGDDRIVGRGHHRRGLPVAGCVPPGPEDLAAHSGGRAAVESAVAIVDVDDRLVGSPEPQARLRFPSFPESVDLAELDGADSVDEIAEEAGATDSGELERV